jgi:hypothetical protein
MGERAGGGGARTNPNAEGYSLRLFFSLNSFRKAHLGNQNTCHGDTEKRRGDKKGRLGLATLMIECPIAER